MGKKVLFVDDTEAWRSLVTESLREAGFEVAVAKDATEAMQETEGVDLGLIILDLNLGGESGITLMRFLKKNFPSAPVLLYTGIDHDEGTIKAMLEEGADAYLHKGNMDELLKVVRAAFRE